MHDIGTDEECIDCVLCTYLLSFAPLIHLRLIALSKCIYFLTYLLIKQMVSVEVCL